jgi:hypothetical protein
VIDLAHEHGIALISPLLLNAQFDSVEYIRSIPDRLQESGLIVPGFLGFEAPFPGTPLFQRMAADPYSVFFPNALLSDFNGYTMVLKPRRASTEDFVEAYKATLAKVTSVSQNLRQIRANTPEYFRKGHFVSAIVDSLLHWSAVFRSPSKARTYVTGSDVPLPELTDVPFTDADFRSGTDRRSITGPWRVTDGEGRVLPQWLTSQKVFGPRGLVNPELAAGM